MKMEIDINGDQADAIVVASLMQSLQRAKKRHTDEDIRYQAALIEVLAWYQPIDR